MKRLWTIAILLLTAVFLWQAGRIWWGLNLNESADSGKTADQPAEDETTTDNGTAATQAEPVLNRTLQTHTVAAGETLHSIGLKYNVKWTSLAAINGLSEDDAIREGTELKLPLTVSGHVVSTQTLTLDRTAAQNAQNDARYAGVTWRYDVLEVVRQTAPSELGISHDTALVIDSRDEATGTATISTNDSGHLRLIHLEQPIDKGSAGVWFVTSTESYIWPN